ncbi:sodium:solute symporter [Bacillus sp. C30]|uniref:sodium:solute symporter n=1 Tax=Bacillus sp. C30 TaxID=1387733 RepID=UPI00349FACE1
MAKNNSAITSLKLGIGTGTVLLLSKWVASISTLALPESIINYGLIAGILYAMIGPFTLILFGFSIKRIRSTFPEGKSIHDYLTYKLSRTGYIIVCFFLILLNIESMFIQTKVASILLNVFFHIPYVLGAFLFIALCTIFVMLSNTKLFTRMAIIQTVLMFSTMIIIPIYFFVQDGITHVYDGIRLYHPYLLFYENINGIYFLIAGILIETGRVLISPSSWDKAFRIHKKKIIPTYLLSGFIWITIPLAFASLIMIVIFSGSLDHLYDLLAQLPKKIEFTILFYLLVIGSLSAITSSFIAWIHGFTKLIRDFIPTVSAKVPPKLHNTHFVPMAIGFIAFFITTTTQYTILEIIFFFGILYTSLIITILFLIFSKQKISTIIPIISIIGAFSGYVTYFLINPLTSIWISMIVTLSLGIFYTFSHWIHKQSTYK